MDWKSAPREFVDGQGVDGSVGSRPRQGLYRRARSRHEDHDRRGRSKGRSAVAGKQAGLRARSVDRHIRPLGRPLHRRDQRRAHWRHRFRELGRDVGSRTEIRRIRCFDRRRRGAKAGLSVDQERQGRDSRRLESVGQGCSGDLGRHSRRDRRRREDRVHRPGRRKPGVVRLHHERSPPRGRTERRRRRHGLEEPEGGRGRRHWRGHLRRSESL